MILLLYIKTICIQSLLSQVVSDECAKLKVTLGWTA